MNKRKRAQLLLLSTFAVTILLVIISIVLMIRVGSLQKQIHQLEERVSVKEQLEQQEALATARSEMPQETAAPTPEPMPTLKPSDGSRYAYLTFDDGPSKNTERILAILDQYNLKATFFVNGRVDDASKARYEKIVEAGHTLAMHSYTHDYAQMYGSKAAFEEDYYKISQLIETYTGFKPTLYRFPGGGSNRLSMRNVSMSTLAEFLHGEGVEYFDWNVDSTDGEGPNRDAQVLYQNVAKNLKYEHNVILLHDANDHDTTVDALPSIIQACIEEGLTFAALDSSVPPVQHKLAD